MYVRSLYTQPPSSSPSPIHRNQKEMELKVAVAIMAAVLVVAAALEVEISAAGQKGLCNMSEEGMMACKPCISTVKPEEKPTAACCAELQQANLTCLCSYKNSDLLPYLGIDPNLAAQLPAKCNMTAPEQC
ncbi:hypothetical protein Cni_G27531 [Canna indica]|uniref:Bifunctional inhibitor/plant lipid transfer protein/seed storage helical domain-containing protein n=1 Tax=Canna indica TaxID=4628 RepID=A0AAQ3QPE1_9LILI|nr:hypothetical protein Cni_G27531 [Canna indica]